MLERGSGPRDMGQAPHQRIHCLFRHYRRGSRGRAEGRFGISVTLRHAIANSVGPSDGKRVAEKRNERAWIRSLTRERVAGFCKDLLLALTQIQPKNQWLLKDLNLKNMMSLSYHNCTHLIMLMRINLDADSPHVPASGMPARPSHRA